MQWAPAYCDPRFLQRGQLELFLFIIVELPIVAVEQKDHTDFRFITDLYSQLYIWFCSVYIPARCALYTGLFASVYL